MHTKQPPPCTTRFVDLSLSRLHIMEAGKGEPLIIVPATISELENWCDLIQFMAQWFHVYFFELPGHGQSSPFDEKFSSQKVAELVEQLADELELERFSLMGFSFGGILAMRTFIHVSKRIEQLILIAPCLDHRAIPYSRFRLFLLYNLNRIISRPKMQKRFNDLIHNKISVHWIAKVMQHIGRLERTIPLERKLPKTPRSALPVLNAQINEILTTEFDIASVKYDTPCYFAMSIYDPLLSFDATLDVLKKHFVKVNTVQLTYPFHQPPKPFTFQELNQGFHKTIDSFMQKESMPTLS
ncbi:MAG TPA: alpha/beta hydrolase [Anaerolineales bacterium]|nr:alpha/beta hydrolase [Anaerolineales bacterium]